MIPLVKCDKSTNEGKKLARKTQALIHAYEARWKFLLGPTLMLALLGGLFINAPLASNNERLAKLLVLGGLAALLLVWGVAIWLVPTIRYKKYREQGLIVEIRDEVTAEFLKKFAAEVEARQHAIFAAANKARDEALLKIAGLDLTTASGQHLRDVYWAGLLNDLWASAGPDEERPIRH